MLLHVADLEKGVRFYRILYGVETLRDRTTGRAWFQIGDTRLGLQQTEAGQNSHIAIFGIRVAPFDPQKVTAGLLALGARVIPSPYEPDVVRLTDPDGIGFRNRRPGLKTRAHARWSGTSRDLPLRRWSGRLKANADRKFPAVKFLLSRLPSNSVLPGNVAPFPVIPGAIGIPPRVDAAVGRTGRADRRPRRGRKPRVPLSCCPR